eukprot:6185507-Pleurochrysis_carterae.AAC.3
MHQGMDAVRENWCSGPAEGAKHLPRILEVLVESCAQIFCIVCELFDYAEVLRQVGGCSRLCASHWGSRSLGIHAWTKPPREKAGCGGQGPYVHVRLS